MREKGREGKGGAREAFRRPAGRRRAADDADGLTTDDGRLRPAHARTQRPRESAASSFPAKRPPRKAASDIYHSVISYECAPRPGDGRSGRGFHGPRTPRQFHQTGCDRARTYLSLL